MHDRNLEYFITFKNKENSISENLVKFKIFNKIDSKFQIKLYTLYK